MWASILLVGGGAIVAGAAIASGAAGTTLVALVAGGPLLVLAAERLGFYAIALWIAAEGVATPFVRYPTSHALLTLDRVWIPVLAAVVLPTATRPVLRHPASRRTAIMIGVYVLFVGVRAALSGGGSARIYGIEQWVDALVLPLCVFMVMRQVATSLGRIRQAAAAFVLAGSILGCIAILEKVTGFELATRTGGSVFVDASVGVRYSGPFNQPDILAVTLLLCLAMTFLWIQLQAPRLPVAGIGALALELTGIWLTYFRGAWIAALVVIVVCVGLRPRRYARLVGMAGVVTVLATVAFVEIGDSQSGLSSRVTQTQNIVGRVATYQEGIHLARAHLLFGAGIDQYVVLAQASAADVTVGGVSAAAFPHNNYVDVVVEQGVIGLGLLGAVSIAIWQLIRQYRKRARSEPDVLLATALTAGALAYFILSMEETLILQSAPSLFLAACLGLGAARLDALVNDRAEERLPTVAGTFTRVR